MMYIREYGEGHIKDRLYIYWDISTQCNYKCEYCYARNKYLPLNQWGKRDTFEHQELIIDAIGLARYPVYLGFHGGEPLLHPKFYELCYKALNLKNLDQLYIVTNGSSPIIYEFNSKFKDFKSKIRFLLTYHVKNCKDKESFIDKVKFLVQNSFKTKVNVILTPEKEYWSNSKYVYQECEKLCKVHPHFIYDIIGNDEVLRNYTDEFYDYFSFVKNTECFYYFEDLNNKYRISDYDIFKNHLNCFKGWKCYNNNYEILWNGILKKICCRDEINLLENPTYFKHLKIKPMICTFDHCNSDGVLKCLKIKENDKCSKE